MLDASNAGVRVNSATGRWRGAIRVAIATSRVQFAFLRGRIAMLVGWAVGDRRAAGTWRAATRRAFVKLAATASAEQTEGDQQEYRGIGRGKSRHRYSPKRKFVRWPNLAQRCHRL